MIIKSLLTRTKGGVPYAGGFVLANLSLPPTKRDDWVVLRGDDLRLKEKVTFRITGGAGPQGKPRPSSCDGYGVRIEAVFVFTIKY